MDVTCERCSTAYEFDDALVSERGTTVKCTSCGHQFKVRRPQAMGTPERWLVRTIDGRELEFRALRELQAAIAQAVITRDDVLSRGGSRPRRLGSIAELEPFFVSAGASGPTHSTSLGLGPRAPASDPSRARPSRPNDDPPRARAPMNTEPYAERPRVATTQGMGMPSRPEVSVAIPLPRGPDAEPPTAIKPRPGSIPPPPPPRRSTPPPPTAGALPGVIVDSAGAPPLPGPPRPPSIDEDALYNDTTRAETTRVRHAAPPPPPPPEPRPRAEPPRPPRPVPVDDVSQPTAPFQVSSLLDPARVRAAAREDWSAEPSDPVKATTAPAPDEQDAPPQNQHTASVPPLTPTPPGVRHSYSEDLVEPRFSEIAPPPGRAGAAKWIVGVVLVGVLALAFATVGRNMLVSSAPAKTGESDARVGALLADGEKSLADGDLESAKEQFDKASVLGERDPRAAADMARFAAARADVDWLRVRLLVDGDPDHAAAQRELTEAAQRAKKAADHAGELAPTDPWVMRSRVDALRLSGNVAGARNLASPGISSASAQPDNALTLAALDLAEANPPWPTVLTRLRTALSTDGNLGRARSMLVYALARSGDIAGARAELDRLAALPRPHPLAGALRAFVSRSAGSVDPNALPDASARATAGKPAAAGTPPSGPIAREGREPREPRERPSAPEPRERPAPEEHVAPPSGPIDTSDLPGVKAPPVPTHTATATPVAPGPPVGAPTAAPAPPPTPAPPAGVDTSDLPNFK